MCGIAGYSLDDASAIDRTLTAQVLLAGIADRGSDAAGYAFAGPGTATRVEKRRAGASQLLESIAVPQAASHVLVHVREYTKGHPSLDANNHPIRHGPVVGIHNGVIDNDEEVFARHGFERAAPGMTVDSEAIFALVATYRHRGARVLEELFGSLAAAWLDERAPEALVLARGIGRPLWIGRGRHELVFASTRETLELVKEYAGVRLRLEEVDEGRMLTVVAGRLERTERFRPDRRFQKETPPAVRAPEERDHCLTRLAAIAATA